MASGENRDEQTKTLVLLMGACALASVAIGWYYLHADTTPTTSSSSGFDLAQVDARPAPGSVARPRRPSGPQTSPLPVFGSLGDDLQGAPVAAGASAASAAAAGGAASKYDRRNEAKFLADHGAELHNYQRRLDAITNRYFKAYPVVRDVDRQFAQMPRYMAVKQRYDQDGNPFAFARDAIALPEVQNAVAQRLADPQAWRAALGMINDALKDPPPPAVYQQAQQFMTGDPAMTAYMTDFTNVAKQNVPALVQGIPPGMDVTPMQKLARDIAPPSALPAQ